MYSHAYLVKLCVRVSHIFFAFISLSECAGEMVITFALSAKSSISYSTNFLACEEKFLSQSGGVVIQ